MTNELRNIHQPINVNDPKSIEALEQAWTEYKKMRFSYFWDNSQPQELTQ